MVFEGWSPGRPIPFTRFHGLARRPTLKSLGLSNQGAIAILSRHIAQFPSPPPPSTEPRRPVTATVSQTLIPHRYAPTAGQCTSAPLGWAARHLQRLLAAGLIRRWLQRASGSADSPGADLRTDRSASRCQCPPDPAGGRMLMAQLVGTVPSAS